MGGRPVKVHLLKQGRGACGLTDPRKHTSRADQVTCEGCRKTLATAVAELSARHRGRRRG